MAIFLILAPYGAFTVLMLMTSATLSLFGAAAVCLGAISFDLARGRSVKILAAGSAILFAGIGAYLALIDPALSHAKVKLAVDSGVLAISLGSMLIRYPFTLQYALESVPAETAAMPGFLRANYVITGAWTLATLLMMLVNVAVLYIPGLSIWPSLVIAFAARNSALYFTKWYSECRAPKFAKPPANALTHTP